MVTFLEPNSILYLSHKLSYLKLEKAENVLNYFLPKCHNLQGVQKGAKLLLLLDLRI